MVEKIITLGYVINGLLLFNWLFFCVHYFPDYLPGIKRIYHFIDLFSRIGIFSVISVAWIYFQKYGSVTGMNFMLIAFFLVFAAAFLGLLVTWFYIPLNWMSKMGAPPQEIVRLAKVRTLCMTLLTFFFAIPFCNLAFM